MHGIGEGLSTGHDSRYTGLAARLDGRCRSRTDGGCPDASVPLANSNRNGASMHKLKISGIAAAVAGLFMGAHISGARAQQPVTLEQSTANSSGWPFNVAPYAWIVTISAT